MAGAYAGDVNDTAVASQDSTTTESTQIDENEDISMADEIPLVSQANNGELIKDNDEGTFAALEREIQNGYNSNITLKNDYAYEDQDTKMG